MSRKKKVVASQQSKHQPRSSMSRNDQVGNQVQTQRSQRSGTSRLSPSQLSQLTQQKASTISLIQKIYHQMEKIDKHISTREKMDEQRYQDLEKRMKKLYKKYFTVKQENARVQMEGTQTILSGLASERKDILSQTAADCPRTLREVQAGPSTQKSKSSKQTSRDGGHFSRTSHPSKGANCKSSIFTESKQLSSAGEPTERSIRSTHRDAATSNSALALPGEPSALKDIELADIHVGGASGAGHSSKRQRKQ